MSTERCEDEDIKQEIIAAYGSLSLFARVADIDYTTLNRVVNGKPCTKADIHVVNDAWATYNPEMIHPTCEALLNGERPVTQADFRWLHDIYLNTLLALPKTD